MTASLIWNDPTDLDLYAHITIKGKTKTIYYDHKKDCGGVLDVDMNVEDKGKKFSLEPVENIFWKSPPGGKYRIFVDNAGTKSHDTKWGGKYKSDARWIPFKVFLNKDGKMQTFSGKIHGERSREVTAFKFNIAGSGGTGG